MLDISGARATATPCAPEEMRRRVGAGDDGRVVPRVLEYLERGEALAEGRRHGEIAGVYNVLGRGGEGWLSTTDLRAGTEIHGGQIYAESISSPRAGTWAAVTRTRYRRRARSAFWCHVGALRLRELWSPSRATRKVNFWFWWTRNTAEFSFFM